MNESSVDVRITEMKTEGSDADSDIDDDYNKRFFEETGWKSILLYQFISGYGFIINISVMLANAIAWTEVAHVLISRRDQQIYQGPPGIVYLIFLFDIIYIIDIIFRLLYSLTDWPNKKLCFEPAPAECIFIDILSVIPYDAVYYSLKNDPIVASLLRLRLVLRLYRVLMANTEDRQSYQTRPMMSIMFWSMCFRLLFLIIPASIHYFVWCEIYHHRCLYQDYHSLVKIFSTSILIATSFGADLNLFTVDNIYYLYYVVSVGYYITTVATIGRMVCMKIEQIKSLYMFIEEYTLTMDMFKSMKRKFRDDWAFDDEMICYALNDYYYHFWQQRRGLQALHVLHKILPPSLTNAIIVDMAYDAIKHSHIFKNLPANLLRHICSLVSFEFAVPGEVIIKKGECVNMMVYISHGVLQILSSEDCETPVLNLSGGTSLGESTLFISYRSSCTVLCQTYCELVILKKCDLKELIKYYPEEFRNWVHVVDERCKEAKMIHKIVSLKLHPNLIKHDLLIMCWIKQFQRIFFNKNQTENVEMKAKGLNYFMNHLIFYVPYLDKLVVSEDIELVKDLVFLKSSFHFILQPNSPILTFWNWIVALLTFFFIIIYPYNLCFPSSSKKVQSIYTLFITIVYWIDVYLQMFTAVKTSNATHLNFRAIMIYRFKRLDFLLDVIAAFPVEIFILILVGSVEDITFMLLQSNRLLKYYKFNIVFTNWTIWNATLLSFLHHIKWIIHGLMLYYFTTVLIYLSNCFDSKCTKAFDALFANMSVKTNAGRLLTTLPLSNALMTGINLGEFPAPEHWMVHLIYIMIPLVSLTFYIYNFTVLIATFALQNLPTLEDQESLLLIRRVLQNFNIADRFDKGISYYLDLLFYFENRKAMHINKTVLSPNLEAACKDIFLMRLLRVNPFFKRMPNSTLAWFTKHTTSVMIPAGLIIYYCGETLEEFYILQAGYCTVTYGLQTKEVTVNENLGLVESILNIPMFHTVATSTDCLLLKIRKRDLIRFFALHEKEHELVTKALAEFADKERLLSRIIKFNVYQKGEKKVVRERGASILLMPEYPNPCFGRLKAVRTGGKFLFYWEMAKTILTIFDLTLFTLIKHLEFIEGYTRVILCLTLATVALDTFHLVDIIVRCLVTYYTEDGIEVFSIAKTAPHYLSRSFFLDLIGAFPLDYMIPAPLFVKRLNKFVYFYRVFGFVNHLTHRIRKVRYLRFLTFIVFFITFVGYASWIFCYFTCTLHSNGDVLCRSDSWLFLSNIEEKTESYLLAEIFLLHVGVFFMIGLKRYVITNFYERLALSLWGILGHLVMLPIYGWCIAQCLFKNADLTIYQQAMKDLVTFLSYCEIDKVVKYEVIQYFEYIWEIHGGKNIIDVVSKFPTSLQKDLLFSFYGKLFKVNRSIFEEADDAFLKELLLFAKQSTFRNTGIIYKVDDILDRMYFLLRGTVEVVGPDGYQLTTLGTGSLFGCLDNCHRSRQTLTMVANGHVETLSITSDHFHKLLAKHPDFQKHYNYLTKFNVDYIACSARLALQKNREPLIETAILREKGGFMRRFRKKVFKASLALTHIKLGLYVMEFFFGVLYELALEVMDITLPLLLLAYARDLIWVLRIYLKFHLAYEDEYGKVVFDRKKIIRNYTNDTMGFYFDLLGVLPIDLVFYFFFPNRTLFLMCRLNRFLRVFYLFNYMGRKTNKLNINVLLVRTINNLLRAYIYIIIKFFCFYLIDSQWTEPGIYIKFEAPPDFSSYSNMERLFHGAKFLAAIIGITTTVGFSYKEKLRNFSSLLLGLFICIDAYFWAEFTANFAATLQVATKVKSEYRQHCINLKALMRICDASKPYTESIDRYTNLFLNIRNGVHFPFLLEEAPYYLREAVLDSMFGFHLRNHCIFKHCHVDFLRQLAATMRVLTYFEGNHVCDMGDIDDTMYFIQEGTVQALTKDTLYTEVCEHLLVAGDSFGLNQILYPRLGHCYEYRASTLTILVTLKRPDFLRLLAFFPSAEKHIYQSIEVMRGSTNESVEKLLIFN